MVSSVPGATECAIRYQVPSGTFCSEYVPGRLRMVDRTGGPPTELARPERKGEDGRQDDHVVVKAFCAKIVEEFAEGRHREQARKTA